MSSLNKCMFIGNLGRHPEETHTAGGVQVCKFSIAVNERRKCKISGEYETFTEWVNIVAFGKVAELCQRYIQKGSSVYIEGKMRTDAWEKDGVKRYSTSVIADQVVFLDKKPQAQQGSWHNAGGYQQQQGMGYQSPQGQGDIPWDKKGGGYGQN